MSNKRLFLLLGFVLAIVGAKADEVAFSVPDFSIEPGETKEISLVMTSTSDDMKFNFNGEMILSEGLSFVSEQVWDEDNEENVDTYVFRTNRLKASHTISENLKAANDLSFVVSAGTKFLSFRAGDAVLTFKVKAAENMELGTASVKLTGMSAAGEDAIELVAQPEYTATVTITKKFSVTVSPADETMGSVTGNGTYETGTEVTITATPNEGYQFSKWSDNTEVNPYVFTVNSDVSLTATFVPIIYNLSYDLANGTLPEGKTNPETYTIESEDIVLNNPERTGYNFAGWTGTGLEETTQEVKIAKGSINDRSYTATWTPITYAISYDLAGGALAEGESNPESYTIENEAITLKNPTKTGYTFAGWTGTDLEAASLEVTIATGKYGDRSYTATWTPITYAISYDLAGGALADGESNPVEYTIESEVITLKNPTKTGYTFAGWTGTDLEAASLEVTIATGKYGDRSYTATWTPITYAISYDLAGGALADGESNPVEYTIESEVITLKNPTKTGYTFAGWTGTDLAEATMEVSIATGKYGDRSYTATWTPITYAINYDLAGGALAEGETNPESYTIESETVTLKNPTKTGYTFAGWTGTDLAEATMEVSIATGKYGDRSYTATWTPITYAISYDLAGGALAEGESNPESYTIESEAITLNNPTREGYTFAGWTGTDLAEATSAVTIAKGSTGNRSYTATWTINQYVMTFVLDNGEENIVKTQEYDSALTAPEAPVKTGFTFKGWSPDVPAKVPASDQTFTAQWERNSYVLKFVADGVAVKEDRVLYEGEIVKPEDPQKEGYTFTGWTPEVAETMPAEDVTYTAQFSLNQYTITFNSDGGTAVESITADYQSALTKPADPTKTGYDFAGWEPEFPETMPLNGASLKATWTPVTYTITYDLAGGALAEGESNPVEYTIESEVITLKNPTKTGYTFAGWTGTDLAEATSAVTIAKGSTGNRSYTATWMINQYVMTFVLDNGEENIVKTQDYDSALTAPDAPVKTGFTFKGWSPDVPAKVPASDQTFTAQWERNSYVLKFVADGVTVKEERVLYEGEIVKPEDPQKEGYTFTGWTPEVAGTMPAEDVTYTAQFTVNQYAVIYIVDDIEWTREYVNYGDEIVLKEYPVEDGQSFSGWTSDVEYQTMPAHDVVFTASLITTRIAGLPSDVKVVNIYDVRGTLLYRDMPVEQVRKQLPKGIYIINGRKYVVK